MVFTLTTLLATTRILLSSPPCTPPMVQGPRRTLHQLRAASARPIIDVRELDGELAACLRREGVNFDVPTTAMGAMCTFASHSTPRLIALLVLALLVTRAGLGTFPSLGETLAIMATSLFWILQEYAIHRWALHSDAHWAGRAIHESHHDLPYYHVSIDGPLLAAVWFSTVAACSGAFVAATGAPLELWLSSLATYTFWGGVYEAAHFMAHTRVPLTGYMRQLRAHHMRHHLRDENSWLAFCVPRVDSLFGTVEKKSVAGRK